MLETDEVDDDYFTPITSTSLANVFGNTSNNDEVDNTTLKYTPPKPQNVVPKSEESKVTHCIFACALFGYEWFNNEYTPKGKLGFAILEMTKKGHYNIVLYDSSKTTLSCTTVSSTLEVILKGDIYISYFDDFRKYWSLYGTEEEIKKIIELLKIYNVTIKHSPYTDKGPPEPNKIGDSTKSVLNDQTLKKDVESDTDSSINRKTKASILSRMASMGHAILPPQPISTERTSDSSDTNEINSYPKVTRHKAIKSIIKRNNQDKNMSEMHSLQSSSETNQGIVVHKSDTSSENISLYTYVNGKLVPVVNTNVVTHSNNGSDMTLFVSEQRINNSELRINMNRMADKVEQILDKMKDLNHIDKNTSTINFQNEMFQKLLTEYENKIKTYEEIIQSKGFDTNFAKTCACNKVEISKNKQDEEFKQKFPELEKLIKEKDAEISKLHNEIQILEKNYNEVIENKTKIENNLKTDITNLTQHLELKNEELLKTTKKLESTSLNNPDDSNDVGNKIKNIMNDTFKAISATFKNDENYSSESIKIIIASVIKKVTIESLNEL